MSSSDIQSIFNAALQAYESKTKNKLVVHPLAAQLQSCDSPTTVLSILQDLIQQLDQRRSRGERARNLLNPTVNVLFAFSSTLGEGVGLLFSPAKAIFAGIGILLLVAKDVEASQEVLIGLLERIENFFKRLESYTELPPSRVMTDTMLKITVEVLSILAIATTEIKERPRKKYLKKLLSRSDIEDALKRLDNLTQEEAQMATAEVLKVTRGVDNKVNEVINAGQMMQQTVSGSKMTIQELAFDVDQIKRNQIRQDLRRWLFPPDPSTNHNTTRKAHYEGTTTWFLRGDIFKEWKSAPSLLWIHGKPGSGKSVLCSEIIENIMPLREAGSVSLAYFYCDFRDDHKQSCPNLLLSIVTQLAAQSNLCCDILSRLFSAHDNGSRRPSDGALAQSLKEMLSLPTQGPVYIIVDALDECPNNSGMPTLREEVLDLVQDLVGLCLPNLHICVTSRPEIDIRTTLDPLTTHRISLHDQNGQKKDIVDYISLVVYSDKRMQKWREEDKRLVIETLSKRADGMFRWVYCQLETLRHCLPPSVKGILDELPATLDETYERILKDINKSNREHAHRLLQCLTVAIRPLRVEELAEVLAIDFDVASQVGIPKLNVDWRWADQNYALLSTCSSLIAIVDDGDSQVVQFCHFSVKEFLTSDRLARSCDDVSLYHILPEPSHTILAQTCLGVLLRLDDRVDQDNAREIPLAEYAARNWFYHAQFQNESQRIQIAMECLFDASKPHFAAWLRVHDVDKQWIWFSPFSRTRAEPLYYAAHCGFYDLTKRLIAKHPEHVNARGGWKVTPLAAALYGNHLRVAELLYHHGADAHVRGHENDTLLHAIVVYKPIDTVLWLLDHGADVNAPNDRRFTPLHRAAFYELHEVVGVLLVHNADIHAKNVNGEVPLHLAACSLRDYAENDIDEVSPDQRVDLLRTMQLLLDHGADVNARANDGSTPLHHSSFRGIGRGSYGDMGILEGTRLLLEHGANIDAEDNEGRTPLDVALVFGRHKMAKFLLEHGARGQ